MDQNHHVMVFTDSYGPFQRVLPVLHVTGEHPESAGETNYALNDPTRLIRVGTVSREVPEAIFLRQLETANWIMDHGSRSVLSWLKSVPGAAMLTKSKRLAVLPCPTNVLQESAFIASSVGVKGYLATMSQ